MQKDLNAIAGPRSACSSRRRCPAAAVCRCQFVISSTHTARATWTTSPELHARRRKSGVLIFFRYRSEDRSSAGDRRHRPRQGRAARPQDERRRRRHVGDAGGRLRQYFGSTDAPTKSFRKSRSLSPERRAVRTITTSARATGVPIALSTVAKSRPDSSQIAQSLPAAEHRHRLGRPFPGVTIGEALATLKDIAERDVAAGLYDRLWRPVAPVRAGIQRLRRRRSVSP